MPQQTIASQNLEDRIKAVPTWKFKLVFFSGLSATLMFAYNTYDAALPHETPMENFFLPLWMLGTIVFGYVAVKNGIYWYVSRKLAKRYEYVQTSELNTQSK